MSSVLKECASKTLLTKSCAVVEVKKESIKPITNPLTTIKCAHL